MPCNLSASNALKENTKHRQVGDTYTNIQKPIWLVYHSLGTYFLHAICTGEAWYKICLDCPDGKYQRSSGASSCRDCTSIPCLTTCHCSGGQRWDGKYSCINVSWALHKRKLDFAETTSQSMCARFSFRFVYFYFVGFGDVIVSQNIQLKVEQCPQRVCLPGKHQSLVNQFSCSACTVARYQSQHGQQACKRCAAGKHGSGHSLVQESRACFRCPSGYFSRDLGSIIW